MKPIILESHQTQCGKYICVIKLNTPNSLNALTLEMVDLIQFHLDEIRTNDDVLAVVLDSTIDKAFCAGGDVVSITRAWSAGNEQLAKDFFKREYALDLSIHTYPKPVICLANGIVMGGGMGLMNGCSHRVVTNTTHMAMPELSIGLFPDVGGSWFLNKAPKGMGLFLGLTAAPINGPDAIFMGLADYLIESSERSSIIDRLLEADWNRSADNVIDELLINLQTESAEVCDLIESNCKKHQQLIEAFTEHSELPEIHKAITESISQDQWLSKAVKNLSYGSPTSGYLIHQQLLRTKEMPLQDVFNFEYNLAIACCAQGDFVEGVRALLIDKDRKPDWKYKHLEEVDQCYIDSFFE